MKENLVFRAWYYFRQGWGIYFAFIFAAINTFTTTYYLAIEKAPGLKELFPSFLSYILITSVIGIPVLIVIGYLHVKRSAAYKAEADIGFEANPHFRRMLLNTEEILRQHLKINQLLVKISRNEKLSDQDLKEIADLHHELNEYSKGKTLKDE